MSASHNSVESILELPGIRVVERVLMENASDSQNRLAYGGQNEAETIGCCCPDSDRGGGHPCGAVMVKMRAESVADLVLMAEHLGVRPSRKDFSRAMGLVRES